MSKPRRPRIYLNEHELPVELAAVNAIVLKIGILAETPPKGASLDPKVSGSHEQPGNTNGGEAYRRLHDAARWRLRKFAEQLHAAIGSEVELDHLAPSLGERCRMSDCRKRQRMGARFCDRCGAELHSEIQRKTLERDRKAASQNRSEGARAGEVRYVR